MRIKQQLLRVCDAYCAATGLSEGRVSTKVYGSGQRIPRLRQGCDMQSGNVEDGLQWFSDHWPEGGAWPSEVPRPSPPPSGEGPPVGSAALTV